MAVSFKGGLGILFLGHRSILTEMGKFSQMASAKAELYWQDEYATFYKGDARHLPLDDGGVDLIITSPPYWGKRDYGEEVIAIWGGEDGCEHHFLSRDRTLHAGRGDAQKSGKYSQQEPIPDTEFQDAYCSLCGAWRGQLGLEPTWQEYIQHLCECAREWWRVLRPTGNLFINIGDTFHGGKGQSGRKDHNLEQRREQGRTLQRREWTLPFDAPQDIGKGIPKMKLGIPYRLRFALNDMGWVSRDDIIWYKGKEYPDGRITKVAVPESVKDRMSCSYEMVFHFVKEPRGYWFDLDAVRKPLAQSSLDRVAQVLDDQQGGPKEAGYIEGHVKPGGSHLKQISGILKNLKDSAQRGQGSNPGDVWIIQPEPFPLKHYAVWPSKLCERMIKVGCPKEVCPKCGKPRERIHSPREWKAEKSYDGKMASAEEHFPSKRIQMNLRAARKATGQHEVDFSRDTIGWSDCGCGDGFVPGVMLDPFCGGSGRVARVAKKLGRQFIGVDVKEDYLQMSVDCYTRGEKEAAKDRRRREEHGYSQALLFEEGGQT